MTIQTIHIGQSLPAGNDVVAAQNRQRFHDAGVLAIDVLATPGAGKTSLIIRTPASGRALNPQALIFEISCRTRVGLAAWADWLLRHA